MVNDFLVEYFPNILDYNFTAKIEKEFDSIAEGELKWQKSIDSFYKKFHPMVEDTLKNSERQVGERVLGIDPKSGRQLSVKIGRYGPIAQIGTSEEEEKPVFASLRKTQSIESITLEEALELFKLPRELGEYEDKTMTVAVGRFGPYIRHDGKFYSIPKTEDPLEISAERGIEIIEEKREADKNKVINLFGENGEIQVLNGRYGPYIAFEKNNYKIPKNTDAATLTEEQCREIIASQVDSTGKKKKTYTRGRKKA